MTQKPSFRQISPPLDVDDKALARLADHMGVPSLVKPVSESALQASQPRQHAPKGLPRPSPTASGARASGAKKTAAPLVPPRSALEKFTVMLPAYLIDALKREAIEKHTTARHVLLLALKSSGYEIADTDLAGDGRRRKTA